MRSMLEFCAIFSTMVLQNIFSSYVTIRHPDFARMFSVPENIVRHWIGGLSMSAVALLVAFYQPEGLASIGLYPGPGMTGKNLNAMLAGLVVMMFVLLLFAGMRARMPAARKEGAGKNIDLSNPAVAGLLQYQGWTERLAYLSVLPFIVIAEDLVYRGYLVLMLGHRTHTYLPWIALSILLSVIIHLYQGRKASYLLMQGLFAGVFIILTITTGNLLAAIVPHLYYDLIWTAAIWRRAKTQAPQPEAARGLKERLALWALIGGNMALFGAGLVLWFNP